MGDDPRVTEEDIAKNLSHFIGEHFQCCEAQARLQSHLLSGHLTFFVLFCLLVCFCFVICSFLSPENKRARTEYAKSLIQAFDSCDSRC